MVDYTTVGVTCCHCNCLSLSAFWPSLTGCTVHSYHTIHAAAAIGKAYVLECQRSALTLLGVLASFHLFSLSSTVISIWFMSRNSCSPCVYVSADGAKLASAPNWDSSELLKPENCLQDFTTVSALAGQRQTVQGTQAFLANVVIGLQCFSCVSSQYAAAHM